ncbi:hypothetical protein Q5H80_20180 [Vibrio sp. SNU_ST1]|uniref:hypothetical protein n=1 Tax=Vibrio sp. SNU_ST1 TaxID=3064001 RepID=UPI00272D7096|nr:hypothetical protein [Vibrio sp. SNU_ST1]WKY59874.1 hypothetical protein Q5H80_20180 [Vibrio sp. SNU_ST1]
MAKKDDLKKSIILVKELIANNLGYDTLSHERNGLDDALPKEDPRATVEYQEVEDDGDSELKKLLSECKTNRETMLKNKKEEEEDSEDSEDSEDKSDSE